MTLELWAFTATTFLSALLLFSLQPMFAKMVLPVLGGSSAVWAVAIFFFQAALLTGYCYAHLLIAKVPASWTGIVHLGLCLLAFVTLPIGLPKGWSEPPLSDPYLWQLGLFAVAIGVPFVAISGNAPLLQAWFARSGHPHGADPYFLYAASNLGSLGALLMYPFVLEPALGLTALSRAWSIGYLVLVVALGVIVLLARRDRPELLVPAVPEPLDIRLPAPGLTAPTWLDRFSWMALALLPAALLTAFTTHITTDIASVPLLWVLPLALYLLTFVLVFREWPLIGGKLLLNLHLLSVVLALLVLAQTWYENWFLGALTGVLAFFTSAMVAHRRLYEARPPARHLTEFYLWMSFGGALGGLTAALIAPKIFSEVFEYPLLIALSIACRPGVVDSGSLRRLGNWVKLRFLRRPEAIRGLAEGDKNAVLISLSIVATGLLGIYCLRWAMAALKIPADEWNVAFWAAALFAILLFSSHKHPTQQMAAALLICAAVILLPSAVRQGEAQRSYYGVHRVKSDDQFRTLWHGTTVHGAQRIRDTDGNQVDDTTPAYYYYPNGPMAQTIAKVQQRLGSEKGRFGIVGLGAGSLACYAKEGEAWRFFEIDPVVVAIAKDPKSFTFLSKCQPTPDIVLGDARLTLAKEPDGSFDLIIVDAFSSEAVPVHLMTAEALKLYLDKIKLDGIVLLNISNNYLDLESVFGATLKLLPGIQGFIVTDDEPEEEDESQAVSTVALFARTNEALEPLRSLAGIDDLDDGNLRGWTDDYSDIFGPLLRKLNEE